MANTNGSLKLIGTILLSVAFLAGCVLYVAGVQATTDSNASEIKRHAVRLDKTEIQFEKINTHLMEQRDIWHRVDKRTEMTEHQIREIKKQLDR